jgi:hypothetical protein
MGVLQGIAEPWDGRSPQQRMQAFRHQYEAAKWTKEKDKPSWKKAWNPTS